MESKKNVLIVVLLVMVGWVILTATKSFEKIKYIALNSGLDENIPSDSLSDKSVKNSFVYAIKLPKKMSFAEETVPLNQMDVRERLDKELTVNAYWHSSTILNLKRAKRYFSVIEPILRKNGVPEDFKYLALAESGLQNIVSPAGATGFWQFMKGTALEKDLIINSEVDERYHIEKSTEAACAYLKQLKAQFGSWTMAAAAYNMGQNGLETQTERQNQTNYYDLILGDETSRYVFRILAFKAIISNPHDFGFYLESEDLYEPYKYKTFIVDETIESWADFCDNHGITYRELKLLNPWLRDAKLTNTNKHEYKILVMEHNQ